MDTVSGGPEVQGTATHAELWGLLMSTSGVPPLANSLVKIVWRMTGSGAFTIVAWWMGHRFYLSRGWLLGPACHTRQRIWRCLARDSGLIPLPRQGELLLLDPCFLTTFTLPCTTISAIRRGARRLQRGPWPQPYSPAGRKRGWKVYWCGASSDPRFRSSSV